MAKLLFLAGTVLSISLINPTQGRSTKDAESSCEQSFAVCGGSGSKSCCDGMSCVNTFFLGERCVPTKTNKDPMVQLLTDDKCGQVTQKCSKSSPCCGDFQCINTFMFGERCLPFNHNDSLAVLETHMLNMYRSTANMAPLHLEQDTCVQVTHSCNNTDQCCDKAQCMDTYLLGKRCIRMPGVETTNLEVMKDAPYTTPRSVTPSGGSDGKCVKMAEKCTDQSNCCGSLECWKPVPMISRGRCMPKFIPLITSVLDQFNIQPIQSEQEFELLYVSA